MRRPVEIHYTLGRPQDWDGLSLHGIPTAMKEKLHGMDERYIWCPCGWASYANVSITGTEWEAQLVEVRFHYTHCPEA